MSITFIKDKETKTKVRYTVSDTNGVYEGVSGSLYVEKDSELAKDSEIILDSITNPRTIADIAFDDFERFDTHDGVSTLD